MTYRTLKSPINIQVEITWNCHNVCRHCYNFYRHDDTQIVTMTDDQIDFLVGEFKTHRPFRGVITGGEPLLVPKKTMRLARGMHEAKMSISLNSTLRYLTPVIADAFWELDPTTTILTSLVSDNPKLHDFVTQRQGSWEKTVAGIRLAIEHGFRVSVNMVLTDWNINDVRSTGDFVANLGVAQFGATRACAPTPLAADFHQHIISVEQLRDSLDTMYDLHNTHGYSVDAFEHYPWCALSDVRKYEFIARRKCTAGVTSCSIGADGKIRPCGHAPLTYENVFEVGLADAWKSLQDWRNQKYVSEGCRECKYFKSCTGGCPVEAMNSSSGKDPHVTGQSGIISLPENKPVYCPTNGDIFRFEPTTYLRSESFGGIIGSSSGGVTLIDDTTFNLLEKLQEIEYFSTQILASQFAVPEDQAESFLGRLLSQGLISKRG